MKTRRKVIKPSGKKSADCKSWPSLKAYPILTEWSDGHLYDSHNERCNKRFKQCRRCGALNHLPLCMFCKEENRIFNLKASSLSSDAACVLDSSGSCE